MQPLITVVTATYNSEKYLQECLDSVLSQQFTDFEHVIIDGYSTDGTSAIIKEYLKKPKNYPVHVFSYPPRGISDAFNKGLQHARGKYIIYLNSDDFFYNDRSLLRASFYLRKYKPAWLQGNIVQSRKFFGRWEKVIVLLRNRRGVKRIIPYLLQTPITAMSHQNSFMDVELLRELGGFNINLNYVMDLHLWLRALSVARPFLVDENFSVFRVSDASTIKTNTLPMLREIFRVLMWHYQGQLKSFHFKFKNPKRAR